MTAILPLLLTEDEAARFLHISARTLRSLRAEGRIRYIRPTPRRVLYAHEDLADYIAANTKQDTPQCPSTARPTTQNARKAAND